MKKLYITLLLAAGCQHVNIKNQEYKISHSTTEIGSIGFSESSYVINNNFHPHTLPLLENRIRLTAQLFNFDKSMYKVYKNKIKQSKPQFTITYVDSVETKPDYVTLNILDSGALLQEYNADFNKDIVNYIKNNNKAVAVTGVAIALPEGDIQKIRKSDALYLINKQKNKYTVALFKDGKKTDEMDLSSGVILAYTLSGFCWSLDEHNKWYIADIMNNSKSCKGNTFKNIKKKQEINLFKM